MSSSTSRLDSPSIAAGASFKRRASPPRSPVMLLSQSVPTRPGQGVPKNVIRLAVGALIAIPTLYFLFGSSGSADIDHPYTGQVPAGGYESKYVPKGISRRVKSWGDGKQWFGGSERWGAEHGAQAVGKGDEVMVDLEEDIPVSTYDGGIAGYTVFSNLYLSAGSLLFVEPDEGPSISSQPLPGVRQIMSGPKRPQGGYAAADEDRWRVAGQEVASNELGKRAVFLKGITYIFNDGPGGEGYLIYFRHFVFEAFLGASRVFASVLKSQNLLADNEGIPLPNRIWFPRCGWKPSWRDDRGENAWFIAHALPGATVEDANGWEDRLTAGLPIIFERIVIIDRWAAHSVPGDVSKWGKMNAGVLPLDAPRSFWSSIRNNVMRSMGVDGISKVGQRGLPVVVYIDVVTGNPKIKDDDRTALIEALKGLTDVAEVHVTKMSAMTKAEQVELMGRAEIVIGLHTDELFTTLWMPATDRSAVIELFEEGGFDRGYELLASSLNHKYIVIQNDKIIDEAGWRAIGGKRGENHNGKIPVDGKLVTKVVREQLTGGESRNI